MSPDYSTKKNRDYWRFVYKTAIEVSQWPEWKTGEIPCNAEEARRELRRLDEMESRCVWLEE